MPVAIQRITSRFSGNNVHALCIVNGSERALNRKKSRRRSGGKIMNEDDNKNMEIKKDDYGNIFLSFLMGTAAMVGIWYFTSILLTIMDIVA